MEPPLPEQVSGNAVALYVAKAPAVAQAAEAAFQQFPHWQRSAEHEREVRKILYRVLLDAGVDRVVEVAERILTMLRREAV